MNAAQYGADLAPLASRGRGPLPVADYRLAHQCVGPLATRATATRRTAVRTPPVARVTLFACVPAGRSFPRARIPPSCASTACRSASDPADGPTADSSPQSRRKTRFRSSRARAANPSPAWISSDTSSARRPSWAAAISSRPCRRRPTSSRGDSPARKICPRRVTVWASSQRDSISCTRRESPRRFASLCWRSTRRFRGTRGPRRCFTRRRRGRVRPCASRVRRRMACPPPPPGYFPRARGGVRGRNRQRRGGRTRRGGRGGEVRRGEERTGVRRVGVKRRDENGAQEFPSNNRPGQTGLEMTLGL